MFVKTDSPNHLGAVSEAAIALEAIRLGIEVYKPISEHARADLVFGLGSRTYRVQCKSARRQGDIVTIRMVSSWHTPNGYVRSKYSSDEVDFFAAHCHELDRNFLIPIDLVDGHSTIQLRLAPTRNGQRAAIHFADDHTFAGAIAQLGERSAGSRKGGGSSPPGSTDLRPACEEVGANIFRQRFGWYMERAAAGTEIRVTKRGRPYVRLVPFQQPLDQAA